MPSQHVGDIQTDINGIKKDQTYLFVDRSFQDSIIEYFQFLRREAILCDVTLRIGSLKFSCHRNILGVASPYFRSLFIDSESGRFIKHVDLPQEIERSVMEAILGYMYGGRIFINIGNAIDIFKAAVFFKLQSLIEECSYVLVSFLTPDNCLTVREISLTHGQEKLHQRCHRFLCENFVKVAETTQFLELHKNDLESILSNNDICTTSEQQVFDSLIRWTEYDRRERGVHFAKLLQHVRLGLLPPSVLMDHVERQQLVQRSPTAQEMVLEALRFNSAQDENTRKTLSSPRTLPRTWSTLVDVILFVGGKGRNLEEGRLTFCYEPNGDQWYSLAPLKTQLFDHSVVSVDGFVYACAGSIEGQASLLLQDMVQCYDPHHNYWDYVNPMQEPRAKSAATEHDGLFYVLGGIINGSHGNSFEVYNPINDKWQFLSPPTVPRSRHAMVTTETHVYVIGGEGQGIEPEISMERYDPAVNLWSFVLPMNCGKVGACAVEVEGKIYVMGGHNGYTTLRQCEVYDIQTHQWNMVKDMTEYRQDAEAVILNRKIYVVGGRDYKGERELYSIECFDISTGEWTRLTSVPIARVGYRCVTCRVSRDHLAPLKLE